MNDFTFNDIMSTAQDMINFPLQSGGGGGFGSDGPGFGPSSGNALGGPGGRGSGNNLAGGSPFGSGGSGAGPSGSGGSGAGPFGSGGSGGPNAGGSGGMYQRKKFITKRNIL